MVALGGCATLDPFAIATLPKGERLNIRDILAAHPNQTACIDYRAASNSCASLIKATIKGNIMTSHEVGAIKLPGSDTVERVEVRGRSKLRGDQACVGATDLTVTGGGDAAPILQEAARSLITEFGGTVCTSYFRAGDGYVISSVGTNREAFPPGDVDMQFLTGDLAVRAQ